MAKKQVKKEEEEEDVSVEVPEEIPCPQHGASHPLKVQMDGKTAFAICDCRVRNNMWKGQRVWELTPSRKKKVDIVEEVRNG